MPALPTLPDTTIERVLSVRDRLQSPPPDCVNRLLQRAGVSVRYAPGMDCLPAVCLVLEQILDRLDALDRPCQ